MSSRTQPAAGAAALAPFFARLRQSSEAGLLLDFDGTLAPFVERRDQARPYEGVADRIEALQRQGRTQLGIVSGRPAADVDARLGVRPRPEIWGSHGLEQWIPGQDVRVPDLPASAARVLEREAAWAHAQGWGDRVERKPGGIAVHWRGLPPREAGRIDAATRQRWSTGATAGFMLHGFDGGVELRPAGWTKARAVEDLRRRLGPTAPIAYLGDDATDEDAFAALGPGDVGVLVRPEARPTAATVWLRPPEELLAFLDAWRDARAAAPPNR